MAVAGGAPPPDTMGAIYMDTPVGEGPWMPAGNYTVRLSVNGQTYTQSLAVKPDPRQ